MSAQELRKVLLRVALDGEFYNLMLVDPDKALQGYNLTDDEKKVLSKPNMELLNKFANAENFLGISITLPHNYHFIAFAPVTVSMPDLTMMTEADKEKVTQLVRDIRNSIGPERFDKIMQLVQQVQGEPPAHE